MKNCLVFLLLAMVIFSSCSMEKRVYSRGFHVELGSIAGRGRHKAVIKNKAGFPSESKTLGASPAENLENVETDETVFANETSLDNSATKQTAPEVKCAKSNYSNKVSITRRVTTLKQNWIHSEVTLSDSSIAPQNPKLRDGHKSATWAYALSIIGVLATPILAPLYLTPISIVLSIIALRRVKKGSKYHKRAKRSIAWNVIGMLIATFMILLLAQVIWLY